MATERDIVVRPRSGGGLQYVSHNRGAYGPMQYPLLFPRGQQGWHPGILQRNGNGKVSTMQYYSYLLHHRSTVSSLIHYAGRLFHQYVVDNYVKIETQRLEWIKHHQRDLRAELYSGLQDALLHDHNIAHNIGQRVILPSSFIGGPRDMRQRFQDAMAIVQQIGKPDLFVTMTCNPEWPEITEQLLPGQNVKDRPDLTARVFRAKLEELKKDEQAGTCYAQTLA